MSRARQRALRSLSRKYYEEFSALWTDRGHKDDPGYDAKRGAAERKVARRHPEEYQLAFAAEKRREGV